VLFASKERKTILTVPFSRDGYFYRADSQGLLFMLSDDLAVHDSSHEWGRKKVGPW
jgi:hypothetical protein